MEKIFNADDINVNLKNTSLALGFFDGVHQGHKKVLQDALNFSKKLGTKSAVLTFKNHPVELLYGVEPEFITTYEERLELFEKMGFDAVIMLDFTEETAQMSAQEYFEQIIMKFSPKSISIGYNHRFGKGQSGDCDFLLNLSKKHDFILGVSSPVKNKNEVTCSTLIRNLIKQGDVKKAAMLLEKSYSIKNCVIHGAQRGRMMNFPTANLIFPKKKIVPKLGVYAGEVLFSGKKYNAIANIGLRPTFGDLNEPLAEIHILDFNQDIYGKSIVFKFLYKIRDEIKFANIEKLREQISIDINSARF